MSSHHEEPPPKRTAALEVAQDGPVMRSVMIRDASSSAPSLSSVSPISQKQTRLVEIPKPRGFASNKEEDATVRISNVSSWKVSKNLPILSPGYPLGSSQHISLKNVPVDHIAGRITQSLKNHSIHVTHQESSFLTAETNHHVVFGIQLFSKSPSETMVAIQRRDGCCIQYHKVARTILAEVSALSASSKRPMPKPRSFAVPASIRQHDDDESMEQHAQEALDMALNLLEKERLDAQLLGMQSLVSLSKCNKTNIVAQQLCCDSSKLRSVLTSLICFKRLPTHEEEEEESYESELEQDYRCKMHRCALTVLQNAAKTSTVRDGTVCASLVHILANAEQAPHEACLAAKCLLLSPKHNTIQEAAAIMEVALEVGNTSHADLKHCTQQLWDASYNNNSTAAI